MKTIYDQLEEETKAIDEAENQPEEHVDEDEEVVEETPEPEEVKEEPVKEPDNQEMARLRWEASEAKRREREAREEAQKAIEIAKTPVTEEDPEPNKNEDREEWLDWKTRQSDKKIAEARKLINDLQAKQEQEQAKQEREQNLQGAIREFQGYEKNYSLKNPDYDNAASFFRGKIKDSISTLNPNLTEDQVDSAVAYQLLQMGSQFVNQQLDPAEAIYNIAMRQGYTKQETAKNDNKPSKPNLETIERNKAKSANGLNAGGGKQPITIASLEKASVQDMYNMSDEEIYNAMYQKS